MVTKKLYLENTYQFYFEGLIQKLAEDEKGTFVILDQTAFYPQGGGQPSDHGVIRNDYFEASVIHVAQHGDQIRHYLESITSETLEGQKLYGAVDQQRRLINARYHTAGHLLSNILESLKPSLKAIKGHSFPGEAYVEFQGEDEINIDLLQEKIDVTIAKNDKTKIFEIDLNSFEEKFYKLPYNIPENKKFRVIQIGDMLPVPCGGTHLSCISEIGVMKINKIKNKKGTLRVSYEVI